MRRLLENTGINFEQKWRNVGYHRLLWGLFEYGRFYGDGFTWAWFRLWPFKRFVRFCLEAPVLPWWGTWPVPYDDPNGDGN